MSAFYFSLSLSSLSFHLPSPPLLSAQTSGGVRILLLGHGVLGDIREEEEEEEEKGGRT